MNQDQFQGQWKQFKGNVQKNWGKLTNDDIEKIEGRREALVGKIQEKYGKAKEQAEEEVDTYISTL